MRQLAPTLRQARWDTEAQAKSLAQHQTVWGTLWSKLLPAFQRRKEGGTPRLASQAADKGGSCISPHTWGQGTRCRLGIKKQGERDGQEATLKQDRQRGSEVQRTGERASDL